jgi:hypothetical protein
MGGICRTHSIECPTRYRTQHFFNNSNTNEDIATKFEQGAGFNPVWTQMVATSITCYVVVAISSLMVKLLKKFRFRQRVGHSV